VSADSSEKNSRNLSMTISCCCLLRLIVGYMHVGSMHTLNVDYSKEFRRSAFIVVGCIKLYKRYGVLYMPMQACAVLLLRD